MQSVVELGAFTGNLFRRQQTVAESDISNVVLHLWRQTDVARHAHSEASSPDHECSCSKKMIRPKLDVSELGFERATSSVGRYLCRRSDRRQFAGE